ncbi:MFS general substrate transporter [Mycena latifolia]|nr:MFS general substrate transporter [Mycena latifolia]
MELESPTGTRLEKPAPSLDEEDLDYTAEEESAVIRILDTRLFPWILLANLVLNMDRTNHSSAISDNLPADLGFTIDTVNTGTAISAVVLSIFCFSGAVMSKIVGPSRWIPILMFAWGLVTMSHALIKDKAGYLTVRVLLAATEGGVVPATLIYLGGLYKGTELTIRLGWFWAIEDIANAVGGLMASGLLRFGGRLGLEGWKWLFLADGSITVIVAVAIWFYLPPNVESTTGGLRFKPWFTPRQVKIAIIRVIRDDPSKREYEKQLTRTDFTDAAGDLGLWGHLVLSSVTVTPFIPLSTYLPTVIKSFDFNVFVSNALTAPPYVVQCIITILFIQHSNKVREHGFHGAFACAWQLVGWIILRVMPNSASFALKYLGAAFLVSCPLYHPLNVGWMSENTGSIGKRTVASGAITFASKILSVWASQIYQADDAPYFKRGNSINIVFSAVSIILWMAQKYHYRRLNKRHELQYAALSEQQKLEEDSHAERRGNKSLKFRFTT